MSRVCISTVLVMIALATAAQAQNSPATDAKVQERCLEVLRSSLQSNEFWPAMHAAEALTVAGKGQEVRTALEPRLPKETDDQQKCGLSRELVRAGDTAKTVVMLEILAQPDAYGHTHAAESLYKVAQAGDGALLRKAMSSPSIKTRLMAAAALAKAGDQQMLRPIRAALGGTDREGRRIAAWILGRIGHKSDIPQLQKNAASEPDVVDKAYAEFALACLGDAGGLAALEKNLRSENAEVRTYAAEIVGHARAANLRAELVRLLDDPALDTRIRAAQSLIVLNKQ